MAPTTFEMYAAFARNDPAKGRKSQARITRTLTFPNIHELERERLTDALAGIAAGLAQTSTCSECGRAAEHLIDGKGSTCARKAS